MNNEQIRTLADFYSNTRDWTRFNYCQAWISDEIFNSAYGITFRLVKSYNTIVALIDITNKKYYEIGKYSRTTSKQVTQIHNQLYREYERVFINRY